MRTREEIIELSLDLMESERANMTMMDGMFKMGTSLEWKMQDKPSWIREEVSTDPYDALTDVTDLYGINMPKLTMTPYGSGEKDRQQSEAIEQSLMWHMRKTLSRRGSILRDIVRAPFQYGRVGAQLVYLPYHEKNMKLFDGNKKRKRAAMRHGPFALIFKDPRTIFPVWSDFMLEGVLNVTVQPAQKVIDFWGEKNCKSLIKELDGEVTKLITQYDYWDYEQRLVWVHGESEPLTSEKEDKGHVVVNAENELPFLPWVVEDISTPLMPLLYPIWATGKWDTMNIHESALVSEVIAYLAAPRGKVEGPNPGSVKQNFGTPQKNVEVPPGHAFEPLPPPPLDQNLTTMIDRLRGAVSKSTIPHSVQTADFGSGTAFASVRELIDLTTRRLNDGKNATERFFTEIYRQMLEWADFMGDELTAYTEDEFGDGGQIKIIPPSKFKRGDEGYTYNLNNLDLQVKLEPDIPEDQVARANAAQLAMQSGASQEKALEIIGVADARKEIERRHSSEVKETIHRGTLMTIEAKNQARAQQIVQAAMQPEGQPGPEPGPNMSPAGAMQGQGANPALGGMPPAIGGGDVTRETAQRRGG